MQPQAGGKKPVRLTSILFWAAWALLALLSVIVLANGFSFMRVLGFGILLAFPLLARTALFGWLGAFVAFILVFSLFPAGTENASGNGAIKTGNTVAAASATIAPSGGTISIDKPGDPLDGFTLTVPAGSYDSSLKFSVSYAPVESQSYGADFNAITPLISVENGGQYSAEMMEITIPVSVPNDSFAMGFIYDGATGKLEGMPLIACSATSITVGTRHFSSFVISMISKAALQKDVDSDFLPGIDDWEFTNYGSYIAPNGHCAGQSMTAMWYYVTRPDGADVSLYGRYDNNGQTPKTPALWQDDSLGYRFASVIQADQWNDAALKAWGKLSAIDAEITRNLFAYAILLTHEPQLVGIRSSQGGGHAMIVYRVSSGLMWVADPNYPGNIDRRIQYEAGAFKPYNSGANAAEIAAGNGQAYETIEYCAKSALVDYPHIASRWQELKSGTIGNGLFPAYKLMYKDADGKLQELKDGIALGSSKVTIILNFSGTIEGANVYRDGVELPWDSNGAFELEPGLNRLGILVTKFRDQDYCYVDFRYVNVNFGSLILEPAVAEGTPGQQVSFNAVLGLPLPAGYKIEWWADGTLKKSGTDLTFSVSFADAGSHDIVVRMVDASGKTVQEDSGSALIRSTATVATSASSQLSLLQSCNEVNLDFGWLCSLTEWNSGTGTSTGEDYFSQSPRGPDLVWNGTSFSGGFTYNSPSEDSSVSIKGTVSADGKTLLSATCTFTSISKFVDTPQKSKTYTTTIEIKNVPLLPDTDTGNIGGRVEGSLHKNSLVKFGHSIVETWNGEKDYELTMSGGGIKWSESGYHLPFIGITFR
jgi:hypothetical protein